MFRKSAYSARNFPGGRREASGGAFQEMRHIIAEEQREQSHIAEDAEADCRATDLAKSVVAEMNCTCPPEPEHDPQGS